MQISTFSMSQNFKFPSFEFSIKSIEEDSVYNKVSFSNSFNYSVFAGPLLGILPELLETNRVEYNVDFINPLLEIKCKGVSNLSSTILSFLQDMYSFTVHDEYLNKDIWVVQLNDANKLPKVFGKITYSSFKFKYDEKKWVAKAVELDALIVALESIYKVPFVSGETSLDRFDFEIPLGK